MNAKYSLALVLVAAAIASAGGTITGYAFSAPKCVVTQSAVQSFGNAAAERVEWDSEVYDTSGMHDPPATQITASAGRTITYADNGGSADTITLSSGDLVADGWVSGMKLTVANSTSNDSDKYTVDTVTATVLTLIASDALTNEGPISSTDTLDGAGTRITISDAGTYLVHGMVSFAADATSGAVYARLYKNGTSYRIAYTNKGNTSSIHGASITEVMELASGDYVELKGRQSLGGALDTSAANCTFSAIKLAD